MSALVRQLAFPPVASPRPWVRLLLLAFVVLIAAAQIDFTAPSGAAGVQFTH